jgi:hypothetical protein
MGGPLRLFPECFVDNPLQRHLNMQPPGRIFDLNEKRRLGAVAHDLDADGAVAFDLPERFQE